jgi:hypothetical protein
MALAAAAGARSEVKSAAGVIPIDVVIVWRSRQ